MRKMILIAGLALATLAAPAMASAQTACEANRQDDRVAGTIIGGIAGAIFGNAIAGHGHRSDGTAVGAVGGALIGNQLARSDTPCYGAYGRSNGYGYAPAPAYREPARFDEDQRYAPDRDYGRGYAPTGYQPQGYPNPRSYDDRRSYGYGYSRECRIETRSFYERDGDYVTRQVRVCR
jgi:opacity protein-like surface antigen